MEHQLDLGARWTCRYLNSETIAITELRKIARLRYDAWAQSGDLTLSAYREEDWLDPLDTHACHWMVYHGFDLVASQRLSVHSQINDIPDRQFMSGTFSDEALRWTPVASLNRLVVLEKEQGQGLAAALLRSGVTQSLKSGARCVIGSPNHRLESFLNRLGFQPIGDPFIDPKKANLSIRYMALKFSKLQLENADRTENERETAQA